MNKSCILQPLLLPHTGNKYSSSLVHKKVHRSTSSSPFARSMANVQINLNGIRKKLTSRTMNRFIASS